MYVSGFRLGAEHKEFVKDVTNVVISYTPVSGIIDTIRFGQKWIRKKRMHQRVANYMSRTERKNFIKGRSRRIIALHGGIRAFNY
jgi:hypothetical protein